MIAVRKLSSEIKALTKKYDYFENRLRRSNLIFLGIQDAKGEAWAQSDSCVVMFCAEILGVTIESAEIDRAYWFGRYQEYKYRPFIVNVTQFKTSYKILRAGPKLKALPYTVRADYSARVRLARVKFFEYVQQRNSSFKYALTILSSEQTVHL